jgi:hypothetical protein
MSAAEFLELLHFYVLFGVLKFERTYSDKLRTVETDLCRAGYCPIAALAKIRWPGHHLNINAVFHRFRLHPDDRAMLMANSDFYWLNDPSRPALEAACGIPVGPRVLTTAT